MKQEIIKCRCGCEQELMKYSRYGRETRFILGHARKNKHNSKKSNSKLSRTRKRLYAEGKIIIWNKNLTKETDERVKKHSERMKGFHPVTEIKKGEFNRYGFKKGNKPWNFGLTKETDKRVLKSAENVSKNAKTNPNYGMTGKFHSIETKGKIGKGNEGKIISEEVKRRNALFHIKFYQEHPEARERASKRQIEYVKNHPEVRKIMSKRQIEYLKNHPEAIAKHREKIMIFYRNHPEKREEAKQRRLKMIIPRKDTDIEVAIQTKLAELGIKFRKHEPITGQPDIFIEPNICIFADGCYWHGCEKCFDKNKFNAIQRKQIVKDILITQKLINESYVVLRFWEHDINKNFEDKVLDEIIFTLNENKIEVDKIV